MQRLKFLAALIVAVAAICCHADDKPTFPLPNPSDIGAEKFAEKLNAFIGAHAYADWHHDKQVRSTGPYIVTPEGKEQVFGTHGKFGVKVYYSPQVWEWLNNNQKGELPDGSMIVKELYNRDPANLEKFIENEAFAVSIMVKDKNGSWDGWFWSDGGPLTVPKKESAETFFDPNAGFGLSCVNCHASAVKESTFSSLRNVSGEPLTYLTVVPSIPLEKLQQGAGIHDAPPMQPNPRHEAAKKDEATYWKAGDKLPKDFVPQELPFIHHDTIVQGPQPAGQKQFITSNQCMPCHDATQSYSLLPNMSAPATGGKTFANLSPFGEWRYSMMGFSGRDPVFFAQLESERALHPEIGKEIDNTCLSCHGVMGQRQFAADQGKEAPFTHEHVMANAHVNPAHSKYGGLARDGVSCMVCHRILPDGLGTSESFTGGFKLSGKPTEVYGPYKDAATLPMEHALGLTPKLGEQLRQSNLCGSCHTVFTPSLDSGKKYSREEFQAAAAKNTFHEQTTYLEWKNSVYSDETRENRGKKSCQDCHMPRTYNGLKLQFRTANIEDNNFPMVDGKAPDNQITLKLRGTAPDNPYSRHTLHGINLFVTEMFDQNPWLLGVQRKDNLYPGDDVQSGFKTAWDAGVELAQKETADVELTQVKRTDKGILAEVKVTNLTGHKFPSGVAFRRAFLELRVSAGEKTLWVSGATDTWGVIGTTQDGKFKPLATEFFENNKFQPHHETIRSEDQVQIFENLVADDKGRITTSFLGLRQPLKDNRLLPRGWTPTGPDAALTAPVGDAAKDANFNNAEGSSLTRYEIDLKEVPKDERLTVTATLYYQSIPPYYLKDRFATLGQSATNGLYYFVNNLNLEKPLKDWKFDIASDKKRFE